MDIAAELTKTSNSGKKDATNLIPIRGLAEILEQHGDWLESGGEIGIQADFSRENLEGADLIDARLQDAILNKAILRRADLDARGPARGKFTPGRSSGFQLAGNHVSAGKSSGRYTRRRDRAPQYSTCGSKPVWRCASCRTLALGGIETSSGSSRQSRLVSIPKFHSERSDMVEDFHNQRCPALRRNAPALPYFRLQADVPYIPFFLFGPVVVLSVYICFHLYLQRLWDGAAQLPAIFLDGRTLDACLPWFARWSARRHFKWLRRARSPLAF